VLVISTLVHSHTQYIAVCILGVTATCWWVSGSEGPRSGRRSAIAARGWSSDPVRLWSGWLCSVIWGIHSWSK